MTIFAEGYDIFPVCFFAVLVDTIHRMGVGVDTADTTRQITYSGECIFDSPWCTCPFLYLHGIHVGLYHFLTITPTLKNNGLFRARFEFQYIF